MYINRRVWYPVHLDQGRNTSILAISISIPYNIISFFGHFSGKEWEEREAKVGKMGIIVSQMTSKSYIIILQLSCFLVPWPLPARSPQPLPLYSLIPLPLQSRPSKPTKNHLLMINPLGCGCYPSGFILLFPWSLVRPRQCQSTFFWPFFPHE